MAYVLVRAGFGLTRQALCRRPAIRKTDVEKSLDTARWERAAREFPGKVKPAES